MDTKKLFVDNFDRLKNHRYEGDKFDKIYHNQGHFGMAGVDMIKRKCQKKV